MSSKSTRREYQLQSPVNTRAQNKRMNCRAETGDKFLNSNKVSNGQNKRKRGNTSSVDAEYVCESLLNENNFTNNTKRIKKTVTFQTEPTIETERNLPSKGSIKGSMIPRLSNKSNKLSETGSLRKLRNGKKSSESVPLIKIEENYVKQSTSNDNANAQRVTLSMSKALTQSANTSVLKKESKCATSNSTKEGLRIFSKSPKNISSPRSTSKRKLERSSSKRPNTEFDDTMLRTDEAELLHDKNVFKLKEAMVVLERLPVTVPLATSSLLLPTSASSLVEEHRDISYCFQNISKFNSKSKTKNGSKVNPDAVASSKLENTENVDQVGVSNMFSDSLISSTPRSDKDDKGVLKEIENEQEEVEKKDATYELIEPNTPKLRNKLKKMRDNKVNSKKEVRFTNRRSDANCPHGLQSCTICDRKEEFENIDITTIAMKKKENILKSPIGTFRNHSTPISKQMNTPSIVKSFTPSRRDLKLKSVTNANTVLNTPLITPVKKPDQKCSATKTMPNFAEIHKKIFAKSESVVDAKRRLEKKHLSFMTSTNKSMITKQTEKLRKKDRLSNDSKSDGLHNRFGFKMRKNDATACILKKTNLKSMRSKQQPTREILKGVRTNRRFELQMKARDIKF